ncbi:NAD-P-binding protein [Sistotremastrum niveocremeum HHB9708]|uniref:NAD-P-binding protein n=2 Tax=Sistotremastraceae TaxID=3402574 RepID=A0A165A6M3_9AGAM|nr:NAD-P-binding protein [Sistotremastrum niveocremeum HHB9708]KZT43522.1 NAD(P)-binding protein [Sistotremastrum suecicum HHB10207 ss-3]
MTVSNVEQIQSRFLSSPKYAVVGASKDQNKYGTKVLKWYQSRSKDVTPIHPKEDELEGISTLRTLGDLPDPSETSVSIITPPKVTLSLIQEAKRLRVPALWLQPGAEDQAVIELIQSEGLSDKVILGGPCILVEGDGIIRKNTERAAL